jgi:transcription elongation factor Elf1
VYRECKKCGIKQKIEDFPVARTKPDGSRWYRRICQPCYQKGKTHLRVRNREWLKKFKKTLSCKVCGYSSKTHKNFVTQALDFHHTKSDKEFAVSDGSNRGLSIKRLKNEINKCEVLCCRCHIEKHWK